MGFLGATKRISGKVTASAFLQSVFVCLRFLFSFEWLQKTSHPFPINTQMKFRTLLSVIKILRACLYTEELSQVGGLPSPPLSHLLPIVYMRNVVSGNGDGNWLSRLHACSVCPDSPWWASQK